MSLKGQYFDGCNSTSHDAELELDQSGLVSIKPALFTPISFNEIKVSSRVGNIPRTLVFPNQAIFETVDHEGLDLWLTQQKRPSDWAYNLESKASYALATLMFLSLFISISFIWGIPWLSNIVADALPAKVNTYIGQGALESMDRILLDETELSEQRQQDLQKHFKQLLPENSEEINYSLVFRRSDAIGANAFALPDGTIVVTDGLVELAYKDEEIISILLHEIGHIAHRHSLRQILNHSGLAMLTTAFLGDVSSTGSLVLGLPNVLMNSSYSRELEWEADGHALQEMKRLNIPSDHFSNFMSRMELEFSDDESNSDLFDYISTHPPSKKRIARFQTAEGEKLAKLLDQPELLGNIKLPEQPDVFILRGLLEQGKFKKLHELIDKYQHNHEQGTGSEITTDTAYKILAKMAPDYLDHFDAWVTKMPNAYTAYLARAVYFEKLAWLKRGKKYISKTSDEQIAGMEKAQAFAIKDLKKVLQLKPTSTIAYSKLISIASTQDDDELKWQYLDDALTIDPASYVIRRDLLHFSLPRWGGSYFEIDEFLNEIKKYIDKNPDLAPLMGYKLYALSKKTYSNDEFNKTIRLATAAIKKGDKSWYYQKRADSYYSLKDYQSALIDYSNAIKLYPYDQDLYLWRARTYRKLDKPKLALKDLKYAASLYPYDYDVQVYLGWVHSKGKRYQEALKSYQAALYYHPDNAKTLYRVGYLLNHHLKKHKEAKVPLSKIIKLNPDNAKYWYEYGNALNALHDCEVIQAYETFLKICQDKKQKGCFDKGINWVSKTVASLKNTHCKS